jgi:hypothetical protein
MELKTSVAKILGDDWVLARDAYLAGEPLALEKMLDGESPIPAEIRKFLAEVVSGELTVNKRGKGKRTVVLSHIERRVIAATIEMMRGIIRGNAASNRAVMERYNAGKVPENGDYTIDCGDVRRKANKRMTDVYADLAKQYGVSEAVIKACAKMK